MLEWIMPVLMGWVAGGAINYLADVLPVKRRIAYSSCPYCGITRKPWFYLWLSHCPSCGHQRTLRSWVVQFVCPLATLWLWFSPPSQLDFWLGVILLYYFALVAVIDIEHRLIMHPVSLVGAILGGVIGIWLHDLSATLLGGITGFIVMLLLYLLGGLFAKGISRLKGTTIDEEAMGFGDVILGGVLGLMIGLPGIFISLLVAILVGGLFSLLYMVVSLIRGKYRSFTPIPYGPFLIIGAFALLFFRDFFKTLLMR